jgi:single-strand DNA-binding protein
VNNVSLIGSVATAVELRRLDGERKVASFLLAVDRPGQADKADFVRIAAWNRQADLCERHLAKGRRIAVDGRLRSRSWEGPDGQRRTAVEVVANHVHLFTGHTEAD